MTYFRGRITSLFKSFGLDLLPKLLDDRKFLRHPAQDPDLYWSFKDQQLRGEALKKVIQDLEKRLADEEKRVETIETKAVSLITVTGLASIFTIGFVELMFSDHPFPVGLRVIILFLYAMIGFCFLSTTLFASRAVRVDGQQFMTTDVSNLWKLREDNIDQVYQEYGADLLQAYMNNSAVSINKANYVIAAQRFFRNTVVLLFLVPMSLGLWASLLSPQNATPSVPASVVPTSSGTTTGIPTLAPTLSVTPSPVGSPSATPTTMPSSTP